MLSAPAMRCRLMAVLRREAMTCGAVPVRVVDLSSSKVISRTQCAEFSMRQCWRSQRAIMVGRACSNGRLPMA